MQAPLRAALLGARGQGLFRPTPARLDQFSSSAHDLPLAIPHIVKTSCRVLHPARLSRPFTINFWPPSKSAQRGERPLTSEEVGRVLPEPLGVGASLSFVAERLVQVPSQWPQDDIASEDIASEDWLDVSLGNITLAAAMAKPPALEPVQERPLFSVYMTSQPKLEMVTTESTLETLRRVYDAAGQATERRAADEEGRPERPVSLPVPDVRDAVPHATYAFTTAFAAHMTEYPLPASGDGDVLVATADVATSFAPNDASPFRLAEANAAEMMSRWEVDNLLVSDDEDDDEDDDMDLDGEDMGNGTGCK